MRFLFIEDDHIAQIIGRHVVESCGYTFDVADSSVQALSLVKENSYQIIFLDLGLPDISGTELIQIFREKMDLTIPIVAITAFDMESKKIECEKLGFSGFIEKPINQDKLMKIIKDVFE